MAGLPIYHLPLRLDAMLLELADAGLRTAQRVARAVGARAPRIMGEAYELGWQDCAEQIERELVRLMRETAADERRPL